MCRWIEEDVGPTVGLSRHRHSAVFFNVSVQIPNIGIFESQIYRHSVAALIPFRLQSKNVHRTFAPSGGAERCASCHYSVVPISPFQFLEYR